MTAEQLDAHLSAAMKRPSSEIRRRVCDGVTVYEKQYTTGDWGADAETVRKRAEREWQLLQSIQANNLFTGRLGVVQVAHCDPVSATIATREIPGQSLEQWLSRPLRRARSQILPWLLAGRWLQAFQTLPLPESAHESFAEQDPTDLCKYCDLRLRSLADYGFRWPSGSVREKLLEFIRQLDQAVPERDRRLVWVHADYAPGNLMWGDGVLTPIDFAMARAGRPLDDATYLIHRLEMHRIYRPWRQLPVGVYRRAILRGLGCEGAEHSPAYRVLMIKHLICRLHTYVRRPARSLKQALHDRYVRQVLRQRLQHFARGSSPV